MHEGVMWGSREWWGLEETGEFMSFVKGELLLISSQMLQFTNVGLVDSRAWFFPGKVENALLY